MRFKGLFRRLKKQIIGNRPGENDISAIRLNKVKFGFSYKSNAKKTKTGKKRTYILHWKSDEQITQRYSGEEIEFPKDLKKTVHNELFVLCLRLTIIEYWANPSECFQSS